MKKLSYPNRIFGEQLRQARKAAGITQEDLAFKAGMDRTYISLLERGFRSPTLNSLFRICKVLNIGPDKFIAQVYEQMAQTSDAETDE